MIQIRTIHPDELAAFAAISTRPEDRADVQNYLDRLLTNGYTHPEWCFIATDNGEAVGRVAYWTMPRVGVASDIVLLDLPWQGDYLAIGQQLLEQSAQIMRGQGASDIVYIVDLPAQRPQWQHYPELRLELLTAVGFAPIRETLRFRLSARAVVKTDSGRLTYRALPEVGDAAFLAALARISDGSLDQRDRDDRAEYGAEASAQQFYKDLQTMDYDPAWWQLGYAGAELVGLVMPAGTMSWGTIGYIGVVPEQRGHGYINDLLARGTAILATEGTRDIQTDTDIANMPMGNSFRRAGYEQFARRREYRWRG